jgi:hypothetical protein
MSIEHLSDLGEQAGLVPLDVIKIAWSASATHSTIGVKDRASASTAHTATDPRSPSVGGAPASLHAHIGASQTRQITLSAGACRLLGKGRCSLYQDHAVVGHVL